MCVGSMSAEASLAKKLAELGLPLPPPAEPKGMYKPMVVVGNLAYTSGHVSTHPDGSILTGRVGDDMDLPAAQQAAERVGLAILSTLRAGLGSLDRVRRVVMVFGLVNSSPGFTQQPAVINGCSQLFADVFGPEAGVGARSAVGAVALPLGAAVEIEATFEVDA